ncbi:MAG: carbohydrate ABC transporter permease [Thermomicrobiales bacterium]
MTSIPASTPARRQMLSPRRRVAWRTNMVGWLFLLPAIALIATLTITPFFQAILLSFQQWDGISPESPFVGWKNYQQVLSDEIFWASMRNVVVFGVVGFVLGNGIALVMAMAVNRVRRLKAFFRTAFYLPAVFSVVVVGLIFQWIFEPTLGILNSALGAIGLDSWQQNWLGDPDIAIIAVALTFVWYHWGFAFILFLAGLQDIPKELYEAADLDGARGWAKFRYITWPHLAPVTTIVSLLTLLAALQIFGTVQVLTNGGPGYHTMVPTLRIYQEAFTNNRYGTAAAMSVLFGGALVVLAIVQLGLSGRGAKK